MLAAFVPTALAGCDTVSANGLTGISVDAHGHPVIVFAVCHDDIDGATIYRDRTRTDPKDEDPSISVATWDAASAITKATEARAKLNTVRPSGMWSPFGTPQPLKPGITYTAYGWTRDNSWYTGHVEFDLTRLAKLRPGQVLIQTYVEAKDDFVDTELSFARFEAYTCDGGSDCPRGVRKTPSA